MATGIAILFSVLVFVSTASSSEFGIPSGPHIPSHLSSVTTDDDHAIRSVQADKSRSSVEVTRVSNKTTGWTYLVMDYGGYVWGLLSRETEEGCS